MNYVPLVTQEVPLVTQEVPLVTQEVPLVLQKVLKRLRNLDQVYDFYIKLIGEAGLLDTSKRTLFFLYIALIILAALILTPVFAGSMVYKYYFFSNNVVCETAFAFINKKN